MSDEDEQRKKSPEEDAAETPKISLPKDQKASPAVGDDGQRKKSSTEDVDKKRKGSPKDDGDKKETRIDIPPPSPPDGDWKTIDVAVLYDKEKCDLNRYDLDTVYKLLE